MSTPLQEWINEQTVGDEMLWKGAFGHQMAFTRDVLAGLVSAGLEYEQRDGLVQVIATHTSKSIRLPVCEMRRPDLGLRLVMRENFYNWKLSVISEQPIEADFGGLFHTGPPIEPEYTGNPLHPVYFEGFPRDLIFGYYDTDHRQWSAEIWGDQPMWTAVFLLMRSVGAVKPLRWRTKESHQRELDERAAKRRELAQPVGTQS